MPCINHLLILMKSGKMFSLFHFQAQQASIPLKRNDKKTVKRGGNEENPEEFVDPETPFGEKKQMSHQMAKQYSPSAVEKS